MAVSRRHQALPGILASLPTVSQYVDLDGRLCKKNLQRLLHVVWIMNSWSLTTFLTLLQLIDLQRDYERESYDSLPPRVHSKRAAEDDGGHPRRRPKRRRQRDDDEEDKNDEDWMPY